MSNIKVLDRAVVEQIAAGEVIERPASIVKELLENAIDAGASRIDIVIDKGGLSRIKITDNGSGIPQDELKLAIQRHATSKLSTAEELYGISTMGFRGEALASISAVCHFTLASSNIGDGMGWSVSVNGGVVAGDPEPVSHLKGTSIECCDLFYNLPARKKFLKSEKAEKMAIVRVVEQVILAFPSIHFTSTMDGKKVYDIPQAENSRMRIAQIAGSELAGKLIHCQADSGEIFADIYISEPEEAKSRPRFQNLYVNLRKINNSSVTFAIKEAFSRFIVGSLKPTWFCFLDIEPNKIDVNVHPTKEEVKFDNEKEIFSFIFKAVHQGITDDREEKFSASPSAEPTEVSSFPQSNQHQPTFQSEPRAVVEQPTYPSAPFNRSEPMSVAEKKSVTIHSFPGMGEQSESSEMTFSQKAAAASPAPQTTMPFLSTVEEGTSLGTDPRGVVKESLWESIPCFQLHRRYVIAPVKGGMMMIDQHAAHERVLYERVMNELSEGGVDSQRLLFPVTIELRPFEKETLMSMRELFEKTGFDIQDFGGNTVAISAVPATGFVKSTQVKDAIEEMLNMFVEENDKHILSSMHRRFAASYACGAAIKFGHEMKQEEMNVLMNALFTSENPHICLMEDLH